MNSKLLLNLILLAAVAALGLVAFLEPGKEEEKTVYLTELDSDGIERFELRNTETLVFAKQDGHWRLTAPFAAPANDIRVRQLLNIAKSESHARYPLKPEELPKFGLDQPKAVLTIGQTRLAFGGAEPIDMMRYVQVGDTLHLVADDFSQHLNAKATDYVDKQLLPEDGKLKAISLPGLKATLGDKSQWTLEPPGDASAVDELANAWQAARAIEVHRHEQPAPGEAIHLALANGQTVDFTILQREPDLLLLRPDWKLEYLVVGEAGKRLLSLQATTPDGDGAQAGDEEDAEAPLEKTPEEMMELEPGEDVDGEREAD
ncbi:MAG: DUF4340 domain-containing protein [Candidatus Methylumidiphilus sp.]